MLFWQDMQTIASEDVTLQLIETKYIPTLFYVLGACPVTKRQLSSIDFVINRFLMKLLHSSHIDTVTTGVLL